MSELRTEKYSSRAGFSLVELIVTIAIMVVMVGGAALSIGLLRSADTQGLASGINSSLTDLKAYSESQKGPIYMYIYKVDDDGYYAHYSFPDSSGVNSDDVTAFTCTKQEGDQKLGSDALEVKVNYDDDPDHYVKIEGSDYYVVQIQKKDGSYLDVESPGGSVYNAVPKWFGVYKSGEANPDYVVKLGKGTGLHYSEQQ